MAVQDRSQSADLAVLQGLGLGTNDILLLILRELYVANQVLAEGLNVQSDLNSYRNDFVNLQMG